LHGAKVTNEGMGEWENVERREWENVKMRESENGGIGKWGN